MSGDGLAALVVWGAIAAGGYYWFSADNPAGDYVTAYQRTCYPKAGVETTDTYYACKQAGGSTMVTSSDYRVDYEHQRVFSLGVWTTRYDNCQVADRYNWNCKSPDGTYNMWMADKRFGSNLKVAAQSISWWQYTLDQR